MNTLEVFQKEIELWKIKGVLYCVYCGYNRTFSLGICDFCGKEYVEYRDNDRVNGIGEAILNCGIYFHPELIICRGIENSKLYKGCCRVKDCFNYYGIEYEDFSVRSKNV